MSCAAKVGVISSCSKRSCIIGTNRVMPIDVAIEKEIPESASIASVLLKRFLWEFELPKIVSLRK
jgi:hypothetical protein